MLYKRLYLGEEQRQLPAHPLRSLREEAATTAPAAPASDQREITTSASLARVPERPAMGPLNLRVLAPPSSDTPDAPTVVVQCGAKKYMINAGEGTTRASAQRRASNTRVDHVFLTRVASETFGGVPGLLMTLADGGRTSLSLYGPPGLAYALATTRFYAKRDTMKLDVRDVSLDAAPILCLRDDNLSVHSVPLVPARPPSTYGSGALAAEERPWTSAAWRPRDLRAADAHRWFTCVIDDAWTNAPGDAARGPARFPARLPPPPLAPVQEGAETHQAPVFAYICEAHEQRGKFDVAAAAACGVRSGPAYAALSRGESVRIERPVDWGTMDQNARAAWLRPRGAGRLRAKGAGKGDAEKAGRVDQGRGQGAGGDADACAHRDAAAHRDAPPLETVEVQSSAVMGASRAGTVFMYMHVPSAAHLDALLSAPTQLAFSPYTMATNEILPEDQRRTPHVILHATPRAVLEDPRYRAWMQSFGPDCHHLVANRDHCADTLMYTSSATSLLRLSRADPAVFAVPGYALEPRALLPNTEGVRMQPLADNQVVSLQPRAPPTQLPPPAPVFDAPPAEMAARLDAAADVALPRRDIWAEYCARAAAPRAELPALSRAALADDITLTTLGTGSSSPSKYRNVLSTLVHLRGTGYILLDAGEGTFFQLARRCGPGARGWKDGSGYEGIDTVLRNLRMIFVSHIHGDHHMGVVRLLLERRKLGVTEPLYLVANNYTLLYLREYDEVEALGLRDAARGVVWIDNEHLDWKRGVSCAQGVRGGDRGGTGGAAAAGDRGCATAPRTDTHTDGARAAAARDAAALCRALRLRAVRTVPVRHRTTHCYGVVLEQANGTKLVFSGDTMPCDALVDAGRDAAVLIHEATMQDDEADLAAAKGHSTIGQAIDVAQRMRAAHLLLTHFSQRYPKLAKVGEMSDDLPMGIAFDMMQVSLRDIRRMRGMLPALEVLFSEEEEGEERGGGSPGESDAAAAGDGQGRGEVTKSDAPRRNVAVLDQQGRGAQDVQVDAHARAQGPPRPPSPHDAPPPHKRARQETSAHAAVAHAAVAHVPRRNIARFEWRAALPTRAGAHVAPRPPSELSVAEGVARALQEMHGVVGSAFPVDVLYCGEPMDAGAHVFAEAVLRVPTAYLDALTSALSAVAPDTLATLSGHQHGIRSFVRRSRVERRRVG
ncbi:ribonuclease Z [Malassezia sp. CBS 17886]|nr:ribonuclease Z [Malassezia sp. CBS 17886]